LGYEIIDFNHDTIVLTIWRLSIRDSQPRTLTKIPFSATYVWLSRLLLPQRTYSQFFFYRRVTGNVRASRVREHNEEWLLITVRIRNNKVSIFEGWTASVKSADLVSRDCKQESADGRGVKRKKIRALTSTSRHRPLGTALHRPINLSQDICQGFTSSFAILKRVFAGWLRVRFLYLLSDPPARWPLYTKLLFFRRKFCTVTPLRAWRSFLVSR